MRSDRRPREFQPMRGRVVLVTGGARRVGAAIVRRLHRAGANIAIHYRTSSSDVRALARALESERAGSTLLLRADLTRTASLAALVSSTIERFGRLDALVNNASSFYPTPLGRIGMRDWEDLVGTNLRAPLFLAQAAAPELARRRGAIVNIVDIHAERPLEGHVVYSLAKGGLATLTRALARELAPRVRVNGVAPGAILWPEAGSLAEGGIQRGILRTTPLGRVGRPEDIAEAVEFLLAGAPYVTGQILAVDGGRSVVL